MSPALRFVLPFAFAVVALTAADAAAAQTRSSDGENRRVRVHNQTGVAIRALSAATPGGGFGGDLLSGPLEPGQSRPTLIDAGDGSCVFTLRASLADGRTVEKPSVNVCRVADVYLTR
jgi:hypothetical protein